MVVVGHIAEDINVIEKEAKLLRNNFQGELLAIFADVRDIKDAKRVLMTGADCFSGVDTLANNAGLGMRPCYREIYDPSHKILGSYYGPS